MQWFLDGFFEYVGSLDDDILNTDEFSDFFEQAIRKSIETRKKEKIELFAKMFNNDNIQLISSIEEFESFQLMLFQINIRQLNILKKSYNLHLKNRDVTSSSSIKREDLLNIIQVKNNSSKDEISLTLHSTIIPLNNLGLIYFINDPRLGAAPDVEEVRITKLGVRFCEKIKLLS